MQLSFFEDPPPRLFPSSSLPSFDFPLFFFVLLSSLFLLKLGYHSIYDILFEIARFLFFFFFLSTPRRNEHQNATPREVRTPRNLGSRALAARACDRGGALDEAWEREGQLQLSTSIERRNSLRAREQQDGPNISPVSTKLDQQAESRKAAVVAASHCALGNCRRKLARRGFRRISLLSNQVRRGHTPLFLLNHRPVYLSSKLEPWRSSSSPRLQLRARAPFWGSPRSNGRLQRYNHLLHALPASGMVGFFCADCCYS